MLLILLAFPIGLNMLNAPSPLPPSLYLRVKRCTRHNNYIEVYSVYIIVDGLFACLIWIQVKDLSFGFHGRNYIFSSFMWIMVCTYRSCFYFFVSSFLFAHSIFIFSCWSTFVGKRKANLDEMLIQTMHLVSTSAGMLTIRGDDAFEWRFLV